MIDWIKVSDRVPSNRRRVLVHYSGWGTGRGVVSISKYNPYDRFEIEGDRMLPVVVNYWAEITYPPNE